MESAGTVGDLGEEGLLRLIAERSPDPVSGELWAGDDAAVVRLPTGGVLVTTDFVVEGVDFDLRYSSGADIGWKAVAINASDIAAMGGTPTRSLASAALPPETPARFFESLLDGLQDASSTWEAPLVGGDLGRAEAIMVSVTMLGSLTGEPVPRSGAEPGDAICVTGSLGGSAGGLLALRHGLGGSEAIRGLISRHLRPWARVREAQALRPFGPHAMIDISDGFALDLKRMLASSGVGCEVDGSTLPLASGLEEVCAAAGDGSDPLGLALSGGDDYELLFTVGADDVEGAIEACGEVGTPVTVVGRVVSGRVRLDGRPLSEREELGWDHLRNR